MSRPIPTYAFATAAELRAIFTRAFEALDRDDYDDDDDDLGDTDQVLRDNLRHDAAVQALRFCCLAAGQLGDAQLLPLVVAAIEVSGVFHDHVDDHSTALGWGLAQLLERGAALDEDGRKLVSHRDARIRGALARSLLPRGEAELALLATLSGDPIAEVRKAAKKTLEKVRDVPWWTGKFASDPIARLTPEEALEHQAAFERISALLDLQRYSLAQSEAELVELAETLPDALAVELAVGLLDARDPYQPDLTQLGTMLLTREGGEAAFTRLCGRWNGEERRFTMGNGLAAMVRALDDDVGAAVCLRLAAAACSAPSAERAMQTGSGARLLAETAGFAFPPGADLTPLLDAALALSPVGEHEHDWVASGLTHAFSADGADPMPVLDRVFEGRLAGYPGPWRSLGTSLDKLLGRAPGAALRPLAERAMASDDDACVRWGLSHLVGAAHDPDRDPPAPELLARFFAEPRYRRVLDADPHLAGLTAPLLRAELRAGRLDFQGAATTMSQIGRLYGGVAPRHGLRYGGPPASASEQEAEQALARAVSPAFLGPEPLRGPPTPEEWTELRAARRRRAELPDADLEELLYPLPCGPWEPEDLALLERCLQLVRDGDGDAAADIAAALSSKPNRDLYPRFEMLLARAPSHCRGWVRRCWRAAAESLGIPITGPLGATDRIEGENDPSEDDDADDDVQWMDEPDD